MSALHVSGKLVEKGQWASSDSQETSSTYTVMILGVILRDCVRYIHGKYDDFILQNCTEQLEIVHTSAFACLLTPLADILTVMVK